MFSSALAVGDPHARNVIGLSPGVNLSHPLTLSQEHLEVIYSTIASIKFIGELITVTPQNK